MAESDPECIKAISVEQMPKFICNLCSRHSNFELFLRESSDVDSHTRGRQHQRNLEDYPSEGDAVDIVEEPPEELRICTLCNKVLKKRRIPAHLRDKRHLAAVELEDLMKPEQAPAPLSDDLDFGQLSKLSNLIEADFLRRSLPQEEIAKRDGYRAEIEDILRVVYPAARVELFGSSLNGFGTIDSDLDLFVKVPTESTLAEALEDMSLNASEASYDPALDPADSVSHSPMTIHRRGAAHHDAGTVTAPRSTAEDVYRFSQAFSAAYALDDDSDEDGGGGIAAPWHGAGELYGSSQALSAVHAFGDDDDTEDYGGDQGAHTTSGTGHAQGQAQASGTHRKRQRKPRHKPGQGHGPIQPEAPHHEGGGYEREVQWQADEYHTHGDNHGGQHGRGRGAGSSNPDRGRGRGGRGDRGRGNHGRGRGRGGERGRGRGGERGRGRGGERGSRGRGGGRGGRGRGGDRED